MNPTYNTEKYTATTSMPSSSNLMYLNRVENNGSQSSYKRPGSDHYGHSNPSTSTSNSSYHDALGKRRSNIANTGTSILNQIDRKSNDYYGRATNAPNEYEERKYGSYNYKPDQKSTNGRDYGSTNTYNNGNPETYKYKYSDSNGRRHTELGSAGQNISGAVSTEPTKAYEPLERRQSSFSKEHNYANENRLVSRQHGLNDTFTSQKAKRDVSEYNHVSKTRPVFSRERSTGAEKGCTDTGFCTIGLENIGNT